MLETGFLDKNDTFFPPLLCRVITIPSASFLTLLGTPFTLVPAIPGAAIIPEQAIFVKQAGTAYTFAGVTNLEGTWGGSTTVLWYQLVAAAFVGFFDQTTVQAGVMVRNQNANYSLSFNSLVGTALTFQTTGANFAAGTGDLKIWLKFRIWPNNNLAWF